MIDNNYSIILKLIRTALWNEPVPAQIVKWDEYEELKKQAIAGILTPILPKLNISSELRYEWKRFIIQQIAYYAQYKYEQAILPVTVPYIVLKGLAVAKYYTHPEYRIMGDIDILPRKEDYQVACSMLLANGYKELTSENEVDFGRHRSFIKNGIIIEVHIYFALLRDSKKGKILDDLLFDNINETHYLPDIPNGLVLLDHINQHLADGLGLRQIIDWMMFVHKCLSDEKWPEFQMLARKVELETLAITVTQMCVLFLGLSERKWCADADQKLCQELMEYVLACGNFGNKKTDEEDIVTSVFAHSRSLHTSFRLLQMRGLVNWQEAKRHAWLRPFAGVYQFFRYLHRGLDREDAVFKLKNEYRAAKKKEALLDKLGVRRTSD